MERQSTRQDAGSHYSFPSLMNAKARDLPDHQQRYIEFSHLETIAQEG
ncbi:MAG: hypothetical protein ACFNWZ_01140 [Candidatus Absconditicoccaceae bacterium]